MKASIIYNRREQPEKSDYIEVHYSEIDQLAPSSLNNIKIIETLDYIYNPEEFINKIITKMRYGAELIIVGTDILVIADKIINSSDIDIDEIRKYFYCGKQSINYYENIENLIKQNGLNIESINLDKQTNQYIIVARKPNAG